MGPRMLPILNTTVLQSGISDPAAAFKAAALALPSIVAYHTCDEASGTTLADATGNNRTLTIARPDDVTFRQDGQIGKCIKITNISASYTVKLSAALLSALDPTNFAIILLLKVPTTAEAKIYEGWNDDASPDYSAFEIRSGGLSVFLRENGTGVTFNTKYGTNPNNEWVMLTLFNSEGDGNSGYYVNQDYIPDARPSGLAGFDAPLTATATGMFAEFDGGPGYIQHIIWLNDVPAQADIDNLYTLAFGAEEYALSFDMRDDFPTTDDAPITSPRTAEPGPGTGTATDTGNNFSIASGQLTWAARVGDHDPRLIYGSLTHSIRKSILGKVTPGRGAIGFGDATTIRPDEAAVGFFANNFLVFPKGASLTLATATAGSEYSFAVVLRRYGAYYFIKGGSYSEWTLVYVDNQGNNATLYPGIGEYVTSGATTVNTLRVCGMPLALSSFGLADSRYAGKVSATQAFTHTADCGIELIIDEMPTAANLIELRFRKQDATNYWKITLDASANLLLIETIAGVDQPPAGTKASTITANSRIFIQCFGTTIRGIYQQAANNVVAWTYSSATNFATETDGEVSITGDGQICDLIVWPRTLAAADAAYLDAALA